MALTFSRDAPWAEIIRWKPLSRVTLQITPHMPRTAGAMQSSLTRSRHFAVSHKQTLKCAPPLLCPVALTQLKQETPIQIQRPITRAKDALLSPSPSTLNNGGKSNYLWVTFSSMHNSPTSYPQLYHFPVRTICPDPAFIKLFQYVASDIIRLHVVNTKKTREVPIPPDQAPSARLRETPPPPEQRKT